jgi:hypothetical protein
MSIHQAFRRQPVPQQYAQALQLTTIPAPTRGIIQSENDAFMGPGACVVSDNWFPTMKGVKLRGGCIRWCDLHALDAPVPPVPSPLRQPVISAFEFISGSQQCMFAAQATKLFDVTATTPVLVKSGQTSGNYCAAQMANLAGYWLIAVNETGDAPLRFNGTSWVTLDPTAITAWANNFHYVVGATAKDATDNTFWKNQIDHTSAAAGTFSADRVAHANYWTSASAPDGAGYITGPIGSNVVNGRNLSYVCKYRSHLFFIETKSMNLWYLLPDSIAGVLTQIPLSGAATHGGYLMFAANWSIDAGDGIDDKLVVASSEGELLIFTGNNPADPNNWRQEGRYQISPPLGMNAHEAVGGDLLIMTVDGIVPVSQAITKSAGELELALITRVIKRMWRDEVNAKRQYAWTMKKWDEYGGIFITTPGGTPGNRYCLGMNDTTGAFARAVGWDVMCFIRMRADMFFGNQDGIVMQADRTGYDDGVPYVATLVGGWELFQSGAQEVVWHQARAIFTTVSPFEPFQPQISATTDFIVVIPPPPPPGNDPGILDVWDQGHWGPDMGTHVAPAWTNATLYNVIGTLIYDPNAGGYWRVAVSHTSAATGTFAADRAAHPTYWTFATPQPPPPVPTAPERTQYAQWDQPGPSKPANRNTMWVSVGMTGFSHAPIVQVTVAQQAKPDVELVAIACTFERAGVNV